jgi:hypothetical protein
VRADTVGRADHRPRRRAAISLQRSQQRQVSLVFAYVNLQLTNANLYPTTAGWRRNCCSRLLVSVGLLLEQWHDNLRQRRQARIRGRTRATIRHWANLARSARLCADLGVLRDRLVRRATSLCSPVVPVSTFSAQGQGGVCTRSHCAADAAVLLCYCCRCCTAAMLLWRILLMLLMLLCCPAILLLCCHAAELLCCTRLSWRCSCPSWRCCVAVARAGACCGCRAGAKIRSLQLGCTECASCSSSRTSRTLQRRRNATGELSGDDVM